MLRLALLALLAACAPIDQESVRTVAAIEIALRTGSDRADLVAMLERHAAANGLHVDDVSERRREFERDANLIAPEDRGTFYVGVWRGEDDDEAEVLADDQFHPGRAWVTFPRGQEPDHSTRVREAMLAEIRQRWPEARPLPILPTGGVPLVDDLVMTEHGYRIVRSAAERYRLPPSSPLLAPR